MASEETQPGDQQPSNADAASPQKPNDAPDEAAPEEGVTELAGEGKSQAGECPPEELEKLRAICSLADQNYNQALGLIEEMKSAEEILKKFHAKEAGVGPQDVEEAKGRFDTAKQSYLQLGNQINAGIKTVFGCAQTHPEDALVQGLYRVYLAKLLASLETRNPIQPFVAAIADEGFEFDREAAEGEARQAGRSAERLARVNADVTMLSVRYQKRQLANRLRQGEKPAKIIERLTAFKEMDPTDINTYIWLCNLLTGEMKTEKDQNKRLAMRGDILEYCKAAFATIDEYLNLQKIENLNLRDKIRSEYVKTITSIRKPLMEGGA